MMKKIEAFTEKNIPFVPILARYDISFRSFHTIERHSPENCLHVTEQVHIYYLFSGEALLNINDTGISIKPGELFLVHDWVPHHFQIITEDCRFCVIQFDSFTLQSLKAIPHIDLDLYAFIDGISKVYKNNLILTKEDRSKFEALLEKYDKHKGFGMDVMRFSTFLEIIVYCCILFKKASTVKAEAPKEKSLSKKAIDFIELHFHEDIDLQDIANNLFVTKNHLCTTFKKETNFTLKQYIVFRRIDAARIVLGNPKKKISDAFIASGFGDYSSFFRNFKKIVGVTPHEYKATYTSDKRTDLTPELVAKYKAEFPDD